MAKEAASLDNVVGYKDGRLYHYQITDLELSRFHYQPKSLYVNTTPECLDPVMIPHAENLRNVQLSKKLYESTLGNLIPASSLKWSIGHKVIEGKKLDTPYDEELAQAVTHMSQSPMLEFAPALANIRFNHKFAFFLEALNQTANADEIYLLREHIYKNPFHPFFDSAVYMKLIKRDFEDQQFSINTDFDRSLPLMYCSEEGNLRQAILCENQEYKNQTGYIRIIYVPQGESFNLNQFKVLDGIQFISEGDKSMIRKGTLVERFNNVLKEIHAQNPEEFILMGAHELLFPYAISGIPYVLLRPIISKEQKLRKF